MEPPKHSDSSTDNKNKWQPLWDWAKHSGFRGLLVFAGVMLIGVGVFAYKTPDPSQRMNILVVGILGVIAFVVTVINAVSTARMTDIMDRQETEATKQRILTGEILGEMKVQQQTMQGQLDVAKEHAELLKPRIRVLGVKSRNFAPDKRPVFLVGFYNPGALDAENVTVFLEVHALHQQKFGWNRKQVMTIPANTERWLPVLWGYTIPYANFDRILTKEAELTVSGYYQLSSEKRQMICFRYFPFTGDRPDGLEEFFPCDFNPGENLWVRQVAATHNSVTVDWGGEGRFGKDADPYADDE